MYFNVLGTKNVFYTPDSLARSARCSHEEACRAFRRGRCGSTSRCPCVASRQETEVPELLCVSIDQD